MVTDDTPDEKRLRPASFVIHATRGVIRDQKSRRLVMLIVLGGAVLMMVAGSTFLKGPLNPHERPGWFVFFWLVCAWMTITAILLAVLDALIVAAGARKAERELIDRIERQSSSQSADSRVES